MFDKAAKKFCLEKLKTEHISLRKSILTFHPHTKTL